MVGSLVRELEAGGLVDAAGGGEVALGPEGDGVIAGLAGEAYALLDPTPADAQSTGRGLDEEEAQLGYAFPLRMGDQEDGADVLALPLGDPTALAAGIMVADEPGDDLR